MADDPRRAGPRIPVESLCAELTGGAFRHALLVELSEDGLRIERPFGGPRARRLQLELEIPGVDEIGWASAEVCFDEVRRARAGGGIVRTSGLRLLSAAQRHRRILREYVHEIWRERRRESDIGAYLVDASCYLRG